MKQCLVLFLFFANVVVPASASSCNLLDAVTGLGRFDSASENLLPYSPLDTLRDSRTDSSWSKWEWKAGAEKTGLQVAQDALQLVESVLPVLSVRSGDVGLPLFMSASGLPPRLVDIQVNGVRWIPGVYGLVDATGLPEALAEQITLQHNLNVSPSSAMRSAVGFSFAPVLTDFRVPRSSINFVRGPFGGDVIRAWIARRLSSRLNVHFTLDQANSSGQFSQMPYDGQKLTGEFGYSLSGQTALRYQYFNSKNEAGAILPFYPEEQLGDSIGFAKESRIFHGVEFSLPAFFVRPFYWEVRNEFRGDVNRVRHRTEQAGIEAGWQVRQERWKSQLIAELRDERITSTTGFASRSQTYLVRGTVDWSFAKNLQAQVAGTIHQEADWPTAFDADLDAGMTLMKNMQTHVILSRRVINPMPAEFANALAILQSNANLKPAELQRATWAWRWQHKEMQSLQIQFAVNRLLAPFALHTLALAGQAFLRNSRNENVPSVDFMVQWQLSRKLNLGGHGSWMVKEVPELFWYQHVRRGYTRGFVEFVHDFFGGDLATRLRLVWRHYGESLAPSYTKSNLPYYLRVAGGSLMDVQLLLRHGSGTVYFSFENILHQKNLKWRPGISAPGYFVKWGVRWDFRN